MMLVEAEAAAADVQLLSVAFSRPEPSVGFSSRLQNTKVLQGFPTNSLPSDLSGNCPVQRQMSGAIGVMGHIKADTCLTGETKHPHMRN